MRHHAITTIALVLSTLLGCNFEITFGDDGQALADEGSPAQGSIASTMAVEFCELLDAEEYEQAISLVSPKVTRGLNSIAWSTGLPRLRGDSGALLSREVKAIRYTTSVPDMPPGEYYFVWFDSTFEKSTFVEKVVTSLSGGVPKVVGYFVEDSWSTSGS